MKLTTMEQKHQSNRWHGSETWELRKKDQRSLLSLEMDFWRRSARVSKQDHIRNEKIREIMKVDHDIVTTIEKKRLVWYGHIKRMGEERWPKKVLNWIDPERLKRGRPPKSWKSEIRQTMEDRGLKDGD